jgi:NAD(P)-dependent dehydrogenase (short-subunit alcohol dehydrogenase family)
MDSVVVTGVSSGIGKAAARALIARGFKVFGSVRKPADAERAAAELGPSFVPLLFDITDEDAVRKAAGIVGAALGERNLAGLVNNAGIAVPGPLLELSAAELRHQLEVNVVGPMIVTRAFAPLLGADRARVGRGGRIVMISSVAGRVGVPFNGPYTASKFAIEGLSESLRRELMLFGIDVIVIAPGAVVTSIWDKAEAVDMSRFAASPFAAPLAVLRDYMLTQGRRGLPAERLGEAIADALTEKRPRVYYTVAPNPLEHRLMAWLPKRMVDRMLARKLGLLPASRGEPQ